MSKNKAARRCTENQQEPNPFEPAFCDPPKRKTNCEPLTPNSNNNVEPSEIDTL